MMSLIDLISFLGSFGLFIYFMLRMAFSKRQRMLNPEIEREERRKEEYELKELLRSLNIDEEDEDLPDELRPLPAIPPPPVKKPSWAESPKAKSNWTAPPATRTYQQSHSDSVYEVEGKNYETRSKTLIKDIPHLQNMLVYYEIFGPPKAFRDD